MTQVDIADLDVVYLSYDEPKKEEFWVQIKNMVPWAVRVDGVEGSDAAHKAAADASTTDRFILIDGDNLPNSDFFNLTLDLKDQDYESAVFRWRARNEINGLMYGNGGLSCWTKDFIYNMKTHEHSDGDDDTAVEFCFDPKYWAMHDCYSVTYPNATPFQAWRAGFREGVKMCLDRGTKPSLADFKQKAHSRNLDNLAIWHNVGRDVENGQWAMLGARLGTQMTMLSSWDYREVQWFENLSKKWDAIKNQNPEPLLATYADSLRRLDLDIVEMNSEQSKFFKKHYRSNWRNLGATVREIDVFTK
tara:strand:+ start:1222 stop:2133 length:912 start_codon:yes stop_codon:yes gene_type:complete